MLATPKYSFRDVERSAVLDERLRELVWRLQRCNERIDQCHLTVGRSEVQIDLSVPGAEIHAHSASGGPSDPGDVFVALNAAFDDARRQLQELHWERSEASKSA